MALPVVLFSSSSENFKPQEFVKQILKVSDLPQARIVADQIESYEWSFETKYYSTTVDLCTTDSRTIGDECFAHSVQAFIHFFDPNVLSSFELAKAWLPYLKHIEPDILILVCNTSRNSDAISRKLALEWCIQNAFELVELNPDVDAEDEDDDFPETTGMARIIQALHAHTWSNMDMKNSPTVQSSLLRHMMKEQQILNKQNQLLNGSEHSNEQLPYSNTSNNGENSIEQPPHSDTSNNGEHSNNDNTAQPTATDSTQHQAVPIIEAAPSNCAQKPDEDTLNKTSAVDADVERILQLENVDWKTLLANEDKANKETAAGDTSEDADDFEQLFMRLKVMKDKAESLAPEERKKYAESVAISFWKAIGGDEDEIDGLDEEFD